MIITWWQFVIVGTLVLVLPQVIMAILSGPSDPGDPRDIDRHTR